MFTPLHQLMENYFPPTQHHFFYRIHLFSFACIYFIYQNLFLFMIICKNFFLFVIICENHFLFMIIWENLFLTIIICENLFLFMIICEDLFLTIIICRNYSRQSKPIFICVHSFLSVRIYFFGFMKIIKRMNTIT